MPNVKRVFGCRPSSLGVVDLSHFLWICDIFSQDFGVVSLPKNPITFNRRRNWNSLCILLLNLCPRMTKQDEIASYFSSSSRALSAGLIVAQIDRIEPVKTCGLFFGALAKLNNCIGTSVNRAGPWDSEISSTSTSAIPKNSLTTKPDNCPLVRVPNAPRRRARADDRYYEENMMESYFHPEIDHHIGAGP